MAKLTVANGGVVKYRFKMKGLDEPPFLAGTGTALVKIDSCTLSVSGSAARCQ